MLNKALMSASVGLSGRDGGRCTVILTSADRRDGDRDAADDATLCDLSAIARAAAASPPSPPLLTRW
jgi:hypothetical protein